MSRQGSSRGTRSSFLNKWPPFQTRYKEDESTVGLKSTDGKLNEKKLQTPALPRFMWLALHHKECRSVPGMSCEEDFIDAFDA